MARRAPRRPVAGPVDCPCGTGLPYPDCCGPLHRGAAAATAVSLMRSRYSAFALADAGYLLRTWEPGGRPERLRLDPEQRWIGLQVLATTGGGLLEPYGTVEFRARYRRRGNTGVQQENSRFVRYDGRWVYAGPVVPSPRD